ncbi:adenosine deaminase [Leptospira borgpetersenii]|uniref:Adenosine deaminase n=1 Tax=Leptospira borgpetersenii str. 200801926 TaxID=1193009 RepID=A0ABP2S4Y9_LEPBO|nr:adenosine deaminase [Leptospira borgpetersenii]EKP14103.1 adenosine deaminase [Leptospira borgpetersenii str. 200801926]ENO63458.1 adenosine deaminase [Leptospira borgpetersenii serovar Mini str. 201000851]
MALTFGEILDRIRIIDRDVTELSRLKSRLPADRPYSSSLQISFDKQINELLNERVGLMELEIIDPPSWILGVPTIGVPQETPVPIKGLFPSGDLSKEKPDDQDVINFLRELPKTEIHLHLEACVNKDTMKRLIAKNGISVTDEEFEAKFNFKDLNGFIQVFFFIQSLVKEPADFSFFVGSLSEYMRANNIVYTEVFFAPSKFIQNGLDFEEMVNFLVNRIREEKENDGITIRLLVDVSRSFGPENAMNNLNRVLKLRHPEVIGIGLGGAELMGPARDYQAVFQKAREAGLRVVAHSGEDDGPWAIWEAVELLKAERIGHGTSAIQDPELVKYLRENHIPIEICVTSNVFTGKYVRKEQNHPVRYYYDQGLPLSINTDDPEIFNVNLTYEYYKLWRFLDFSLDEIVDLIRQGVFASFHPNKESLWSEMEKKIHLVKARYGLKR